MTGPFDPPARTEPPPEYEFEFACRRLAEMGRQPRAKANGGRMARCPLHDDRNPSLSVDRGRDGETARRWYSIASRAVMKLISVTSSDCLRAAPELEAMLSLHSTLARDH